jgi:hypothetical protein
MKKLLFLLISVFLISCNQPKVNVDTKTHLELLNIKGSVKSIDISISENEFIDGRYVPKTKGMNVMVSNLVSDINPVFGTKIVGDLSSFIDVYDSFSIANEQLPKKTGIGITDITVKFNKRGYITEYTTYNNNTLEEEKVFSYDNKNRLVKFIWYSAKLNMKKTDRYTYEYNYNNDDLIIKKEIIGEDKTTIYSYNYGDNKITVQVKDNISGSDKAFINLNKNKKIIKVYNDSSDEIYFKNNLISRITNYTNDNVIITDNLYEYENDRIVKSKKSHNSEDLVRQENIKFYYNTNGYINQIKSDKDKITSSLTFNYNFDTLNNWTNLEFNIDRKTYDFASNRLQQIRNKRNRIKETLSGRELMYFIFDNKEEKEAFVDLEYVKKLSSQIEIRRDIFYY